MREILFHGKRKSDGKWVFGMPWIFKDHACICPWKEGMCKYDTGFYPVHVIPETVGQYTGLTDKNGKKIFENDIIRFAYAGTNKGVDGVAAVIFQNGKFCVEWGWHKEIVCLDGFSNTTIEIIGNIHDNPELMKRV